jgi:hypothetical protein
VVDSYECGHKPSAFIIEGQYLDYMRVFKDFETQQNCNSFVQLLLLVKKMRLVYQAVFLNAGEKFVVKTNNFQ